MIPTFLIIILCIYVLLYLFDRFYKTCAHYPYIQFLKNTGFEIKFLQVKWETAAFNRLLLRWGSSHSSFLTTWFTIGLNVTLIFLPISCVLLLISLYQIFFKHSDNVQLESSILVPIIPGANLAISDLPYYVVSLIISSVIHEFGHALTAVKEDVHLVKVGIAFILILPIAYVKLNTEDMLKLNPIKSLRIFCAGVWHNIALSLSFYLIFLLLPFVFAPFYHVNRGLVVVDLTINSPLMGNNGLNVGNHIYKINNCDVNNYNDWVDCINKFHSTNIGFCTPSDVISTHDETVFKHTNDFNCCSEHRTGSLCFEYVENTNGILESPPHTCLPVRTVATSASNFCNSSNDCKNTHCLKPMLKDNGRVLIVKHTNEKMVVYLGLAQDLLTVGVSEYVPKYDYLNLNVPIIIEKFFKYIVVISLGLAVLNVVPSLWMDGHHISNALIKILLGGRIQNEKLYLGLTLFVPFFGTLLFSSLVFHTLWVFLFK